MDEKYTETKVAIFKSVEFGFEKPSSSDYEDMEGYVRISEYVDVEFPLLSGDEQIAGQVRALDSLRDAEMDRHRHNIAKIAERKSRLLAITHKPEISS